MKLLILSLLMAFGGQPCGFVQTQELCRVCYVCNGLQFDLNQWMEIPLHPYPLWRMEAQEPQVSLKNYLCDGACMNAELMPTQKPQILIDHMPLSTVSNPDWIERNYQPITIPPEPIDVPAVRGKEYAQCRSKDDRLIMGTEQGKNGKPYCMSDMHIFKWREWTCTDPSRSLESSVDGLKHWCHRQTN